MPYVRYRVPDRPGCTRNELFEIYSCRYLSANRCRHIVSEVEKHVSVHGWELGRHRAHPTKDVDLLSIVSLRDWVEGELRGSIFPTLGALYGFDAESDLALQDLFFVKVRPLTLTGHQCSLLLAFLPGLVRGLHGGAARAAAQAVGEEARRPPRVLPGPPLGPPRREPPLLQHLGL